MLSVAIKSDLLKKIKYGFLFEVKRIIGKYSNLTNANFLLEAVSSGNIKLVEYLQQKGCDINKCEPVNLFKNAITADESSLPMLKFLQQCGLKLENYSDILLECAIRKSNIETVKYLATGCDIKLYEDRLFGFTADVFSGNFSMIKCLISLGCKPVTIAKQNSLIKLAIKYESLPMLKYMVEHGCMPQNLIYRFKKETLKSFEIVKYLVNLGHQPKDIKFGVINWIIDNNHFQIVDFLFENVQVYSSRDLRFEVSHAFLTDNFLMFKYLVGKCGKFWIHEYAGNKFYLCDGGGGRCLGELCSVGLYRYAHYIESDRHLRLLTEVDLDMNTYFNFLNEQTYYSKIRPLLYSFCILTKKNKTKYLQNSTSNDNFSKIFQIFEKQLTTTNFTKKNNLLKFILKPMSLHMQLTSIE
jgi:hypothetical protein